VWEVGVGRGGENFCHLKFREQPTVEFGPSKIWWAVVRDHGISQ
jgi:hypothetical protein